MSRKKKITVASALLGMGLIVGFVFFSRHSTAPVSLLTSSKTSSSTTSAHQISPSVIETVVKQTNPVSAQKHVAKHVRHASPVVFQKKFFSSYTPVLEEKDYLHTGLSVPLCSTKPSPVQMGVRANAFGPHAAVIADVYFYSLCTLPVSTRVSLGYRHTPEASSSLEVQIAELFFITPQQSDTPIYGGAGISVPLSDGAKTGLQALVGVSQKTSLLGQKNEALFTEVGFGTSGTPVNGDKLLVTLSVGYSFSL